MRRSQTHYEPFPQTTEEPKVSSVPYGNSKQEIGTAPDPSAQAEPEISQRAAEPLRIVVCRAERRVARVVLVGAQLHGLAAHAVDCRGAGVTGGRAKDVQASAALAEDFGEMSGVTVFEVDPALLARFRSGDDSMRYRYYPDKRRPELYTTEPSPQNVTLSSI